MKLHSLQHKQSDNIIQFIYDAFSLMSIYTDVFMRHEMNRSSKRNKKINTECLLAEFLYNIKKVF